MTKIEEMEKSERHSRKRKGFMDGETTNDQTHDDLLTNMFL